MIAYFLGNIYAKTCRNRTLYVKIIACQRWDVFSRHSVEWHGRRVNYRRPIKSASLYTDLHVARLSHSQQVPTDSPKRRRFVKIRRQVADEYTKPAALVTGQPADTPTRGLPTRGLDISQTGQFAVSQMPPKERKLSMQSRRWNPRVVQ